LLKTSEDPELVNILKNEYPFNSVYKLGRNENRQRYEKNLDFYDNVINMCDYIEKEFKNKLLALTCMHPSEFYYVELISRIFKLLEIDIFTHPIKNLEYFGSHGLNPRQFNFFTKTFPNLDYGSAQGRNIITQDIQLKPQCFTML